MLLLDPSSLAKIAELFWARMSGTEGFQLACLEMTGIPLMVGIQAFALAHGREVNGLIVRKERKKNGRLRAIEGTSNGLPVVFLDDIFNSGASIRKAHAMLHDHGLSIESVWSLVDFGNQAGRSEVKEIGAVVVSEFHLDELGVELRAEHRKSHSFAFEFIWKFSAGDMLHYHVVPKSTPALDAERLYFGTESGVFIAL